MASFSDNWQLEDFDDGGETSDIDGTIQVRHHWVLSIHQVVHANYVGSSALFATSSSIAYFVGALRKTKSLPVGIGMSGKWICTHDGFGKYDSSSPAEYLIRRQVWEFYGKWMDPPTGWGI